MSQIELFKTALKPAVMTEYAAWFMPEKDSVMLNQGTMLQAGKSGVRVPMKWIFF
jgi:hypothetical protein